jgi:hypothetical protein
MTPTGPGARLDYILENDSLDPPAVQISIVKRVQVEDGTETLTPADNEFLVFPAQLILLPKEKRTVRIQWLGPVKPERELAEVVLVPACGASARAGALVFCLGAAGPRGSLRNRCFDVRVDRCIQPKLRLHRSHHNRDQPESHRRGQRSYAGKVETTAAICPTVPATR